MSVEGPGALLRAAREKLSIEVREISDALNLPISAIEAIESDDFDAFQAPVFARGHVRSYAKLVELDVDEVMAAFPAAATATGENSLVGAAISGSAPAVPEPVGAVPDFVRRLRRLFDELYREQPTATMISLFAIVALFVLLLWWLFSGDEAPAATKAAQVPAPEVNMPAAAPSPFASIARDSGASPSQPSAGPAPSDAGASGSGTIDADAAELAASEASAVLIPDVAVPDVVDPPADAANSAASQPAVAGSTEQPVVRRLNDGDDRLRLTFNADCWVDVKDADGRRLFGNLGAADSTLELVGGGPFRILLGYAPGASLAFNGDPVALAPHTRNNVARLVVGQ